MTFGIPNEMRHLGAAILSGVCNANKQMATHSLREVIQCTVASIRGGCYDVVRARTAVVV
jgi:hypothetical protein